MEDFEGTEHGLGRGVLGSVCVLLQFVLHIALLL